jgi:hypothetical protein
MLASYSNADILISNLTFLEDGDVDEGIEHCLPIPAQEESVNTEARTDIVPVDLVTQPPSPNVDVGELGTQENPIIVDWECQRCGSHPEATPVIWGSFKFCFPCTLLCPNCYLYVPLGATCSWNSTYLCKVCYISASRNGGWPLFIPRDASEDDIDRNDLLALENAAINDLGTGFLVKSASEAAATGKKRKRDTFVRHKD